MVASTRIKHRWDMREYADITTVRHDRGVLRVSFLDGSEVHVAGDDLEAYGVEDHEWQGARSEVYHLTVPTRHGEVEIPWDVLRALTDPEFREFLAEHAAQTSRHVGSRLRELREERGLATSQLAEEAGVTTETIDRLEAGDLDGDLEMEDRILGALDLTRDQAFPVPSRAYQ